MQSLNVHLKREEKRRIKLEEELMNLKSNCKCSGKDFVEASSIGLGTDSCSKAEKPGVNSGIEVC